MANIFPAIAKFGVLTCTTLSLTLLVSTPSISSAAEIQTKYKKNTSVDFEEALVEGKSRKPYSAYLYKQQEQNLKNLSNWSLNMSKKLELSSARLGE